MGEDIIDLWENGGLDPKSFLKQEKTAGTGSFLILIIHFRGDK